MNWAVFAVAVFFWWEQNCYFGWNLRPASNAELLADGITAIIFALAVRAA